MSENIGNSQTFILIHCNDVSETRFEWCWEGKSLDEEKWDESLHNLI